MRKGITCIIALILLCGFSLPCAAQAVTAPGDTNNDIYAKYTSTLIGYYADKSAGGSASVTTAGGITIAVKGLSANLTLVVMPVLQSDTQAWNWFGDMMNGKAEMFIPFDIYFTDESGNTVTVNSDTEVTISVPDDYTNPIIYNLFPNETINKPGFSTAGKTLTFTYAGNGYIILASAVSNGETGNPNEPGSPDTGDIINIMLWVLVCGAGLLGFSVLIAGRNRKRYKTAAAAAKGIR